MCLGEFHSIHVSGTIDKGHDQIQGQGRQSNATKDGKEEPAKPGHETGIKGTDGNLKDQVFGSHIYGIVFKVSRTRAWEFGDIKGGVHPRNRRNVVWNNVSANDSNGIPFKFLYRDFGIRKEQIGNNKDQTDNDKDKYLVAASLSEPRTLDGVGCIGRAGHEHAIVRFVVKGRKRDQDKDPYGNQPKDCIP